tara:strand:- start:95 stop:712 length:618 start_codon:yes stop_codon:yes gene_type:complete
MIKKKKYKNLKDYHNDYFIELNKSFDNKAKNDLKKIIRFLEKKYKSKSSIFVCGNGGSAAIANHFECDHKKILADTFKIKPKILSLCGNNALITAIANDYSYDQIFKKQLEYLSIKNDVLITISSSGNSENIIEAIKYAKKKSIKVISFTGFNGGRSKKMCDLNLHVKSKNYGIIENLHHAYMNIISQFIKFGVLSNSQIRKYKF